MYIIKVKAKVKLTSEENMEIEDIVGERQSKWVWRDMAFNVEDIIKIVEYNSEKCIIYLHDNEKLLVREKFEEVYQLWLQLQPEDFFDTDEEEDENYEISSEEE